MSRSAANGTRSTVHSPAADIIDGKTHPELFMPYELFDSVVRRGFLDEEWREIHEHDIAAAGLPDNFWERLGPIANGYVELLRGEAATSPSGSGGASERSGAFVVRRCQSRTDALEFARREFGEAFDRFMYIYVAPGRADFLDELSDAQELRRLSRGCR